MCDKSSLALYSERIQRLAAEGFKLLAYNCHYESCGKEIIDAAAEPGERKELLSSCPYCQGLFRKLVTHDAISTWLSTLITEQSMQATVRSGPLAMPVPDDCTDLYAAGWAYGDNHVSSGGSVYCEAGPNWHEEKAIGFWDRLAAERERNAEIVTSTPSSNRSIGSAE